MDNTKLNADLIKKYHQDLVYNYSQYPTKDYWDYEFKDKEEASNIVNDGKHYISVYESGNISLKSTLDLKEVFSTQYNTNKIQ